MGYNVYTINNIPDLNGYYIFLIGKKEYAHDMASKLFFQRFDEIAERIGVDSAIVKSHNIENLSSELLNTFEKASYFRNVYDFFRSPGIAIMNKHPKSFNADKDLLAVITFDTLNRKYTSDEELILDIVELTRNHSYSIFDKCFAESGNGGFLRRMKNAFVFEPNFYGIGIDLKKIGKSESRKISDFFKKPE